LIEEDKMIPLHNRIGLLENKIETVSLLINKYKDVNIQADTSLEEFINQKNIILFDGNFNSILKKMNYSIEAKSHKEKDFAIIVNNAADSHIEFTKSGKILNANIMAESLLGYNKQELIGNNFLTLLLPEYKAVFEHWVSLDNEVKNKYILFQCCHKDGGVLSVEGYFEAYLREKLTVFGIALRSISNKNELLTQLQKSKDNYDALSETVNEVILRIDEKFTIVYSNSAIQSIFGYNPGDVIGKNLNFLFPPEILKRYEKEMHKYFYVDSQHRIKLGINNSIEILGQHKNRGVSPMEISFGNTKDFEERTLTCIIRDISLRKNAERKLHKLAYFDQLTNLGNRDLFSKNIADHLLKLKKEFELGSLMFLDLDGFKTVNDTLGHNAGDLLLVETAKRLHDCLRESDSVYRLGGDEFLVLLRKIREKKDAAIVAKNILNTIRMPYYLKYGDQPSHMVNVGVSIGIILISASDQNVDDMTKKADLAMYASKNSGKNRFTFYTEEMVDVINERWELEQGLKIALAHDELELHYQPIVDISGRIKGLEALLRWKHPQMGYISPAQFIPIAEETNMIIPIGAWVIERSCLDITIWNNMGYDDIYVSVNFSTKQFEQDDVVDLLKSVISRTKCNPKNLKLELTETGIMQAPEETIIKMKLLKKMFPKIQIMVDDFGTGYSSLNYLANLPADILKIDLSFVSRLNDSNNRKIVNAIINLAESLEMGYIAEGIETVEEWNYFKEKKCNRMQGYYFSKPVESSKVVDLLKKGILPV
jgi:diguanylate cyclase (GGDEF)-like protein/PAS domain S-box-containing protein